MLVYEDPLSKPSIEINMIWETLINKENKQSKISTGSAAAKSEAFGSTVNRDKLQKVTF